MTTPEPESLDGRHRDTLRRIFEHPTSHNIEWHEVTSLLDAVGDVTVRHDGKVAVKVGPELEFLDAPAGKDIRAARAMVRSMKISCGALNVCPPRLLHPE